MPVYKNNENGTWYVLARYLDWKGERKQKCKRGFATSRMGTNFPAAERFRYGYDL